MACIYSSGTASWREIAQRIVTFPPLIALVLALALSPVAYPAWLTGMLHRLGDTLAPLALVSVGLQLRLDQLSGNRVPLGLGLGFKLVVGPLLIALVYFGLLSGDCETSRVTISRRRWVRRSAGRSWHAVWVEPIADHADGRGRDSALVRHSAPVVSGAGADLKRFKVARRAIDAMQPESNMADVRPELLQRNG